MLAASDCSQYQDTVAPVAGLGLRRGANPTRLTMEFALSTTVPAALATDAHNESSPTQRVTVIFCELREPIYRFLVCGYCSPGEAEEVVQETFLRMYRELVAGKCIDNDRSWAYTVARNLALKQRRRDKYEPPSLAVLWDDFKENVADPAPSSEEQLLGQERADQLEAVIQTLTERQLQCLQLRADGLRYREIAAALEISLWGAVEAIELAVVKLRKGLRARAELQTR